jgi:CBS domain-containing protein
MRRRWISLSPGASLYEGERVMRLARIRQVPVVHEGTLLGLVHYRDLLAATIEWLGAGHASSRTRTVSDVLARAPEAIGPEARLVEAVERMARAELGCLPVVEVTRAGPMLVGLVTESDLLRAAYDPLFAAEWS